MRTLTHRAWRNQDRKWPFPIPGGPRNNSIPAPHVTAGRELPDQLGIDRGLGLEVEALQSFLEREAGHRDPHLMVLLRHRAYLGGEQFIEQVGVGDFLFRRLLEGRAQFVLDLIEPQLVTARAKTFELRYAHCASA